MSAIGPAGGVLSARRRFVGLGVFSFGHREERFVRFARFAQSLIGTTTREVPLGRRGAVTGGFVKMSDCVFVSAGAECLPALFESGLGAGRRRRGAIGAKGESSGQEERQNRRGTQGMSPQ